jgi:hypothetical protein
MLIAICSSAQFFAWRWMIVDGRGVFFFAVLTAVEKCGARRVKRGGPKLQRAVSYFV